MFLASVEARNRSVVCCVLGLRADNTHSLPSVLSPSFARHCNGSVLLESCFFDIVEDVRNLET
jgi:hypothetical protein